MNLLKSITSRPMLAVFMEKMIDQWDVSACSVTFPGSGGCPPRLHTKWERCWGGSRFWGLFVVSNLETRRWLYDNLNITTAECNTNILKGHQSHVAEQFSFNEHTPDIDNSHSTSINQDMNNSHSMRMHLIGTIPIQRGYTRFPIEWQATAAS